MTIAALAKELGVTRQAIYMKLKRAGMSTAQLHPDEKGNLPVESVSVVRQLFSDSSNKDNKVTELTSRVNELNARLQALQSTVDSLTAERDAALDRAAKAEAAAAEWKDTAKAFERAASEERQLHAAALKALEPPHRESIWSRMFNRKQGSEAR